MPSSRAPGAETTSRKDNYNYTSAVDHLTGSRTGLPILDGVVPPAALPEGGLAGFDPHVAGTVHLTGERGEQQESIDLSILTKEEINEIVGDGSELRRSPGIAEARAKSHEQYQRMAAKAAAKSRMQEFQQPLPMPTVKEAMVSVPTRLSPLAMMQAPAQRPPQPQPAPAQQPRAAASEPEFQVVFEIQGHGPFEVWYHDVIREGNVLVVVYDRRFKGIKYLPPDLGENPLFVDVVKMPEVFIVNSVGINFPFQHYDCSVLIIAHAKPKEAASE